MVYDYILGDSSISELENLQLALAGMGLLTKSKSGKLTIQGSEEQDIVRFFNRLLSLEVDRQNALFEYFYKAYTEPDARLKASAKYVLGLKDIKAQSVGINREPQLIHRDLSPVATTWLNDLKMIVPTAPTHFND